MSNTVVYVGYCSFPRWTPTEMHRFNIVVGELLDPEFLYTGKWYGTSKLYSSQFPIKGYACNPLLLARLRRFNYNKPLPILSRKLRALQAKLEAL